MEDIAALQKVPMFAHLDSDELTGLHAVMEAEQFAPHTVIIREGEPGDKFFVVLTGNVQFSVHTADGIELVVAEAGPGGFFGELSMLTGAERSARVRALNKVRTWALGREAFLEFVGKHPQTAISVLEELARRLHSTDSLLKHSVSRNVNEIEEKQLTFGMRMAQTIAFWSGSLPFMVGHIFLFLLWILFNQPNFPGPKFDHAPFDNLALLVGLESALLSISVLISQNREAVKERLMAEMDHKTNTKVEIEIGLLLRRVDDLELIVRHHADEQREVLEKLTARLPAP